jgi:transcriptional regulator EpsA
MSTHSFTPAQVESLIRLLEASVDVKRRYQFYLWTQGDLQRLVPHKLAACGSYDLSQRDLSFDVLNSIPLAPEVVATLNDVRSPVISTLLTEWIKGNGQPVWVDMRRMAEMDATAQGLVDNGYHWLLLHAVTRPGRPHELESFFVFGSPNGEPDALAAHALHLFLPYLHCTYTRVFSNECELATPGRMVRYTGQVGTERARVVMNLTEREREILRWVRDGKSNQAISDELGISALTVKNHVQKILRKLGASNRAQAVAKALMMNVFNTPLSASPTRSTIGLRTPQAGGGATTIE